MATGRVPTTANSPLTAKGDLFGYSTTQARVAVGNNGETLVADSSASTGLRYQGNFSAGKNKIINGDFGIWQRGTSFTTGVTNYVYTVDRWLSFFYGTNTSTVTQQTFTPGAAPVAGYEGQFFARFSSTTGANFASTRIEDVRTLAGQTVTVSFYLKSASNQVITVGVNQNFGSGGSASVAALSATGLSVTTSWQRFSVSFTMPSISGKTIGTGSYIVVELVGAINNALDIWGVQLEAGSVATAFQTATGTIQGELAACQRYYYFQTDGAGGKAVGMAAMISTTQARTVVPFPVTMRANPTAVVATGTNFYGVVLNGTSYFTNSLSINAPGPNAAQLFGTISAVTAGWAGVIEAAQSGSSIAFSAEL